MYPVDAGDMGTVRGAVIKGPVAFASVTAYRLDDHFQRGDALATAQADGTGHFSMTLPPYAGHVLFAANSGVYTEEAVGSGVKLDGSELLAVVHDYRPGSAPATVLITPVSHWAVALASYRVASAGEQLGKAVDDAYQHLNAHFGGVEWRTTEPTDFNSVDGGVGQGDADRAGLLLAALSQQALGISNRAAVTPGVGVTALDLVQALADDLGADGYFDGVGKAGPLHLPADQPVLPPTAPASATAFDGQTLRGSLAAATSAYLQNPLDTSGLSFRDVQGLLDAVSADGDTQLFRDGGSLYDVTPPMLQFAPVPPLYTSAAGYVLSVLAADPGSGVAAVYAQTGANTPVSGQRVPVDAGTLPDGGCVFGATSVLPDAGCVPASLYQFTLLFPAQAHYPYTVYAVDNAGNSTQTNATSLAFTITFDNSPPNINLAAATVSYIDERQLQLVTSHGSPVVPAAYAFSPTAQRQAIAGGDVYKVSTRLSWGATPPTAAQLDAQDGATLNVPFLDYQIPYNAATDAPIVTARYRIVCGFSCGEAFGSASGELIADPAFTAAVRYLLPLTRETMLGVDQLAGTADLSIEISVTDAAGNTAVRANDSIFFHLVGPPLAWTEDSTYPSAQDTKSTFPYAVSFASVADEYANAFSTVNFAPDGMVRLVRYLVQNPHAGPVALTVGINGDSSAYQQVEVWDNTVQDFTACDSFPNSFCGFQTLSRQFTSDPVAAGAVLEFPSACVPYYPDVAGAWQYQWRPACPKNGEWYYAGYVPAVCSQPAGVPTTGVTAGGPTVNASSPLSSVAYDSPQSAGGETAPAAQVGGAFVVPGASGSAPGRIVVYLARPANVPRIRPLIRRSDAMADTEVPLPTATNTYNVAVEDFWQQYQTAPCYDANGTRLGVVGVFLGRRHGQFLASAATQLTGSVTFGTVSLLNNSIVGEGAPWGTSDFSRSISQ